MKYTKALVKVIIDSILAKKGRVQACKDAGISYQCFLNWMGKNPNQPDDKKIEFIESIKKAERQRNEEITTYAELSIVKAMKSDWRSAAWWLERTNQNKYALKQYVEQRNIDAGKDIDSMIEEELNERQAEIQKKRRELRRILDGNRTGPGKKKGKK